MNKKTVRDIDLKGKRVLMRVDFNVPMADGKVTDDKRIKAALPTIKYVLEQGASLLLASHLGRPKGGPDPEFSLKAAAEVLAGHLGIPVKMAPDCVGPEVEAMAKELEPGEVLMLENTRFHKEETSKDAADRERMATVLASYGDVYVNDAFGSAHRPHVSTETVAKFLPAVAGFLMEKELEFLEDKIVKSPAQPFVAVIGGAKVSSKIAVLENLLAKVDHLIIGGGMAYTFLTAKGIQCGESLVEKDMLETARDILEKAYNTRKYIYLPIDHIVTQAFSADAPSKQVARNGIEEGWMGMDIGPLTIEKYTNALKGSKTVFWNGPMGVFEFPRFAVGTNAIAKALSELKDCTTVIGGGDSVSAVKKAGLYDKMSHISTGGGASLELVEGKVLPGVAALMDKKGL